MSAETVVTSLSQQPSPSFAMVGIITNRGTLRISWESPQIEQREQIQ
jgi:hypothetical protein